MSDLNSPEFRQRAAEAAARRRAADVEEQARLAAEASAKQSQIEAARRAQREREQRIDRQLGLARQIAQVVLSKEVPVNRQWVVAKSHNFTLKNRASIGKVLAEGWLLRNYVRTQKMDDGFIDTWSKEIVLTTTGGLLNVGGPFMNEGVTDLSRLYVHKIPHPNPAEYAASMLQPCADFESYQKFDLGGVDNALDAIDDGLAEFAGLHGLVD